MAPADSMDVVPEKDRSRLLSGLGFYKLSRKRQQQLSLVFVISGVLHVVGLLVFGGWIIMRSRPEQVTMFKTPPPSRKYDPRKLEHRVKIKKRQRSSSRPSMIPRIVSMKMSQLALPEIKMDPKLVHTTFQPKFKAVSGKGLGAGLGTGYGTHGFGVGVSAFNFFGIHARGEKIAILVDVSVSMVEEQRGGVAGYWRVKQRLGQVIDALAEGTLFNLVVFADAASILEPKSMIIANNKNKKRSKLYLQPFNTVGNWGHDQGNLRASSKGKHAAGGTTRLDLALTGAFMQGADTILIISDGAPKVRKTWGPEQMQAFRNRQADWGRENAGRIAAWNQANAAHQAAVASVPVQTVSERVWVPPTPAVPPRPPSKSPPKEGQAPDRGDPGRPAQPGHWQIVHHRTGGGGGPGPGPAPSPPPIPDPGWWTLADFIEHLTVLHKDMYLKKGKKPPQIHCIGYQIDDEGHAFLTALAKQYHGQYRRVRTLR